MSWWTRLLGLGLAGAGVDRPGWGLRRRAGACEGAGSRTEAHHRFADVGRRWLDDCSVGAGSRRLRQPLPAYYQRTVALGERGELLSVGMKFVRMRRDDCAVGWGQFSQKHGIHGLGSNLDSRFRGNDEQMDAGDFITTEADPDEVCRKPARCFRRSAVWHAGAPSPRRGSRPANQRLARARAPLWYSRGLLPTKCFITLRRGAVCKMY